MMKELKVVQQKVIYSLAKYMNGHSHSVFLKEDKRFRAKRCKE